MSRTPVEIDTALAELYLREMHAKRALNSAIDDLHRALGERSQWVTRGRKEWPTTDAEALKLVRAKVAAPDHKEVPWGTSPAKALAAHGVATANLAEIEGDQRPLHEEFSRRGGWSRFFVVKAHNGHVHSSMNCQTCNRNGSLTDFGWNPELSGLTEAEAVASLGPNLCTVCFPSAPVEWTVGNPAALRCEGSGRRDVEGQRSRTGMNTYGQCAGCGERFIVTKAGRIRAHKPAAQDMR